MKIGIYVGDKIFIADLYKNEVSENIAKLFPLTLRTEQTTLNSKDFYAPLDKKIEGTVERTESIVTGDISICNSISVSLCIKASQVNSKYVKIGHISEPFELREKLLENKGLVKFDFLESELEASA